MIEGLIWLLVVLIVLAIVAWVARAILAGLGAPSWLFQALAGILCILAVVIIARTLLGGGAPALR